MPPREVLEEHVGFSVKIKVRYVIEKELGGVWVPMARLSEDATRIAELCQALGGKIRVQDLLAEPFFLEGYFE